MYKISTRNILSSTSGVGSGSKFYLISDILGSFFFLYNNNWEKNEIIYAITVFYYLRFSFSVQKNRRNHKFNSDMVKFPKHSRIVLLI